MTCANRHELLIDPDLSLSRYREGLFLFLLTIKNVSYVIHLLFDCLRCFVYDAIMLFEIGERIRQERKQRKMSQSVLAKLLGMSRSTISQIENGTVQDIGVRKLIRILEALDLELRVRPAGSPPTLDELREDDDQL